MKCPFCKSRTHIDLDLHADGFSQDARECGDCGAVWTFSGNKIKTIKGMDQNLKSAYSDFLCPTCKSTMTIKTDLDAFQFHEELYECTTCGTVCASAHNHLEIVTDSQNDSFLSSTTDRVEGDDYVFA